MKVLRLPEEDGEKKGTLFVCLLRVGALERRVSSPAPALPSLLSLSLSRADLSFLTILAGTSRFSRQCEHLDLQPSVLHLNSLSQTKPKPTSTRPVPESLSLSLPPPTNNKPRKEKTSLRRQIETPKPLTVPHPFPSPQHPKETHIVLKRRNTR